MGLALLPPAFTTADWSQGGTPQNTGSRMCFCELTREFQACRMGVPPRFPLLAPRQELDLAGQLPSR